MQLHQLRPIHKTKKEKRVGRGGKRGFYSGRGTKGQKSRSGRKMQPVIRELIKRYPKLRGSRAEIKNQKSSAILNVETIEKKFNVSDCVNPQVLLEKGLIRKISGRTPSVKILGKGQISKSVTIENCFISKGAKEKIEKAGGVVK